MLILQLKNENNILILLEKLKNTVILVRKIFKFKI